jgi:acyl dehydratase
MTGPATVIDGRAGLRDRLGEELGVSGWRSVDQPEVDRFAELTGDRQWIHVDVARAAAGPFGATIVHGYLLLSLAPALAEEIYAVCGFGIGLNYGLDRMRFPAPLPVGASVRLRVALTALDDVNGGLRAAFEYTFERESGDRPVCVATKLTQYLDG